MYTFESNSTNSSSSYYQIDDLIRCIIKTIEPFNDICQVSLTCTDTNNSEQLKLGPVLNKELPAYLKNM